MHAQAAADGFAAQPIFHSLADGTRRQIFERLCRQGELTVAALTAGAGVSQPAVSKHLRILKAAGLVSPRASGRETHYRARPEALTPMLDWASAMERFWESRFDKLEDLLDRMD